MLSESPELRGVKPVKLTPEEQAVLDDNMLAGYKNGLIKKYSELKETLSALSDKATAKLKAYLGNPNTVPSRSKLTDYSQDTVEGAALHAYYAIQDKGGNAEAVEDDDGNPFAALKGLKLE